MSESSEKAVVPTAQFARGILIGLHQTTVAQEAGALEGDVEAVHDMRVAIRRLRVALSNFAVCLSREDRRRLRARLKHLADALGLVRDLDVMIAALESARKTSPTEDHPAIKSMIRRLRARRRRQHRQLINYLRGEEFADFKREFSSLEPEPEAQNIPLAGPKEHGQAA
ncbi:MAG: CHAD domain-containing protein [Acidobacteria bacterium]|nr:CHAD domain-containing protein [Acidobacteriota bacterium]